MNISKKKCPCKKEELLLKFNEYKFDKIVQVSNNFETLQRIGHFARLEQMFYQFDFLGKYKSKMENKHKNKASADSEKSGRLTELSHVLIKSGNFLMKTNNPGLKLIKRMRDYAEGHIFGLNSVRKDTVKIDFQRLARIRLDIVRLEINSKSIY